MDASGGMEGEAREVGGGSLLVLDDPETVWLIRSGSVAVFAGVVEGGSPTSARRYLFRASAGTALFGTAPAGDRPSRAMVAVPTEATALVKITARSFARRLAEDGDQPGGVVQAWLRRLESALSDGGSGSGEAGEGPGDSGEGPGDRARSGLLSTAASEADLFAGLAEVQQRFLLEIDRLEQRAMEGRRERVVAREREQAQGIEDAFEALASVIASDRPAAVVVVDKSALLAAARAVGGALGIAVAAPASTRREGPAGVTLEGIVRASGIRIRNVRLDEGWWRRDCGPLLGFIREDGRPVALLPRSSSRYELFDPARRARTEVDREKAATLRPAAVVFYRPLPEGIARPLDLLKFGFRGNGRAAAVALAAGIAGALLAMLTPVATAVLVDLGIPDADRALVWQLGLALAAAAVGKALFDLVRGYATVRLETASVTPTQAALFDRLLRLRPSFFRHFTTGDLVSRALAISALHRKLGVATLSTLFTSLIALLNFGLMLYFSPRLAVVAGAAVFTAVAITIVAGAATVRRARTLRSLEGEILGATVQLIQGVARLRVAAAERLAFASWGRRFADAQKLERRVQRIQDGMHVFNQAIPTLAAAAVFAVAAEMLGGGAAAGLTVGSFVAFHTAFGVFISGGSAVSNTVVEVLADLILWERARPILADPTEVDATKSEPGELSGRLLVRRLTFRYRESGPLTLEDVSVRADPGEFIAIVGPSGSGKSTLLRLIVGFETPSSGSVYYDGKDLAGLDLDAVRRQLGVVLQHSSVLSGSILDNIAAGAPVTLDEAWGAARDAGLADDILAMPMGIHTYVSEGGTNLSGGQLQRLLLARALVARPKILLFDEATSALDNRAQAVVSQSLERLRVTRIVIAHRLSTIRKADRVYVIERGRVTQEGSFEELAAVPGLFARLMARQKL